MRCLFVILVLTVSLAAVAEVTEPMQRRALQHDGIEREYFVHIPAGAVLGEGQLPAVVALHGYTSTATGFQSAHALNRHANEHRYIVIYVQGSHFKVSGDDGQQFLITGWNELAANLPETTAGPHCTADSVQYPCPPECGGQCGRCGYSSCYDDVGLLERILDESQAEFPIDIDRVYLLGVSHGAAMTLRAGCRISRRFAAIAPIIGQLPVGRGCGPSADLPMLLLFGGKDETIRFDGTAGKDDGFIYVSTADTAAMWADALACEAGPARWSSEVAEQAGLVCTAHSSCRVAGHEVVSCMDPEAAHWWPSQGYEGVSATCVTREQFESLPDQPRCPPSTGDYEHLGMDLLWQFFSRYRRIGRNP